MLNINTDTFRFDPRSSFPYFLHCRVGHREAGPSWASDCGWRRTWGRTGGRYIIRRRHCRTSYGGVLSGADNVIPTRVIEVADVRIR